MNIYDKIKEQNGVVKRSDLPAIIEENRLALLLVRCGGCRFLAPAQDVEHLAAIIERDGMDYVRDISEPADRPLRPTPVLRVSIPHLPPIKTYPIRPTPRTHEAEDFGGSFDGVTVTSDADPGL